MKDIEQTKQEFAPLVAVITRTKDRPQMLRRAISSVGSQTLKDYLHVIVNDGGDASVVEDVINEFSNNIKQRIKCIHNKTSHGMEAASNIGLKASQSKYIAIHDDDDTWAKDFLKQTTERLTTNGMKGVVVHTEQVIEAIEEDGTIKKISSTRFNPEIREINFYDMFKRNYATPITFLFERSVFDVIGMYDESLMVCGDWDFALRFIRHWDIDFLDSQEPLAFYHLRPDATGINGNSVISGFDKHRYYTNLLSNKYLREDLENGSLGMGFMFNFRRQQNAEDVRKGEQRDRDRGDDFERLSSVSERVNGIENHLSKIEQMINDRISPHRLSHRAMMYVKSLPRRVVRKLRTRRNSKHDL